MKLTGDISILYISYVSCKTTSHRSVHISIWSKLIFCSQIQLAICFLVLSKTEFSERSQVKP